MMRLMTHIEGIDHMQAKQMAQKIEAKSNALQINVLRESTAEEFSEWVDMAAFNPLAMRKTFEDLKNKAQAREEQFVEESEKQKTEHKLIEKVAKNFESSNPELSSRTLLILASRLTDADTVDDIIRKLFD